MSSFNPIRRNRRPPNIACSRQPGSRRFSALSSRSGVPVCQGFLQAAADAGRWAAHQRGKHSWYAGGGPGRLPVRACACPAPVVRTHACLGGRSRCSCPPGSGRRSPCLLGSGARSLLSAAVCQNTRRLPARPDATGRMPAQVRCTQPMPARPDATGCMPAQPYASPGAQLGPAHRSLSAAQQTHTLDRRERGHFPRWCRISLFPPVKAFLASPPASDAHRWAAQEQPYSRKRRGRAILCRQADRHMLGGDHYGAVTDD